MDRCVSLISSGSNCNMFPSQFFFVFIVVFLLKGGGYFYLLIFVSGSHAAQAGLNHTMYLRMTLTPDLPASGS